MKVLIHMSFPFLSRLYKIQVQEIFRNIGICPFKPIHVYSNTTCQSKMLSTIAICCNISLIHQIKFNLSANSLVPEQSDLGPHCLL